jgi:hypothetical protein
MKLLCPCNLFEEKLPFTIYDLLFQKTSDTMKKLYLLFLLLPCAISGNSQTVNDLFQESDVKISWLGIDFSHVKLIGNFAEFFEAGEKSSWQIRDIYFPRWNYIILGEPEKYDIKGMLRKPDIWYDIDMIGDINARTSLDEIESYNAIKFTGEDIQSFVDQYNLEGKEGIGVLFIAECLNKNAEEAYYHFVAINMKNRNVLFHERLRGEPNGFGLRNYWANSIFTVIRNIREYYFGSWKSKIKPSSQV